MNCLLRGQWPNICVLAQSSDRSAADWCLAWKNMRSIFLLTHIFMQTDAWHECLNPGVYVRTYRHYKWNHIQRSSLINCVWQVPNDMSSHRNQKTKTNPNTLCSWNPTRLEWIKVITCISQETHDCCVAWLASAPKVWDVCKPLLMFFFSNHAFILWTLYIYD